MRTLIIECSAEAGRVAVRLSFLHFGPRLISVRYLTDTWSRLALAQGSSEADADNSLPMRPEINDKDAKASRVRKPRFCIPDRDIYLLDIKPHRPFGTPPPWPPHQSPNNQSRQGPPGSSSSPGRLLLPGGRSPHDTGGLGTMTTLGYACHLSPFFASNTSPHRSMVWNPKFHSWSRLLVVYNTHWLCLLV